MLRRVPHSAAQAELHLVDEVTVGVVISGECSPAAMREIDRRLTATGAHARCLVVDMSQGSGAPPELARAIVETIQRAEGRGFGVAVVRPGPEVARSIAGTVELVPTVDEGLARVRGRLTPGRTIRVRACD
jgi:hypothetical protein